MTIFCSTTTVPPDQQASSTHASNCSSVIASNVDIPILLVQILLVLIGVGIIGLYVIFLFFDVLDFDRFAGTVEFTIISIVVRISALFLTFTSGKSAQFTCSCSLWHLH
jgi:hypothetical protein